MKILHVGLCANGHPYNGLQRELSAAADYYELPLNTPELNEQMLEMAFRFRPDIIFMQIQSSEAITPDTVKELNENHFKVYNWTGDVRDPIPDWYRQVGKYCTTLFSNMHDVDVFKKEGFAVDYLQIGIDHEIFKPEGVVWKAEPIIFMGNNYHRHFPLSEAREQMVHKLKDHFGDQFGVYGGGWNGIESGNLNGDQESEAALYRGCKVAINYSHFNYERYFSDRMLRLMGSGAFCLSHCYNGMNKDWSVNDVVEFYDTEELIEKIEGFLKPENDNLRTTIAKSGCAAVHQKFTYKNMVQNLIKIHNGK